MSSNFYHFYEMYIVGITGKRTIFVAVTGVAKQLRKMVNGRFT